MQKLNLLYFLILFFLVNTHQSKAQSLRSLILYSDAIVVAQESKTIEQNKFLSDYYESKKQQTNISIAEWLKTPLTKNLLKNIIVKDSTVVDFIIRRPEPVESIEPHREYYNLYFLKKTGKIYQTLYSKQYQSADYDLLKKAIPRLLSIKKIKDTKQKFSATVDWILENSKTDSYYRILPIYDLDTTSVFMRFYKQKSVIDTNNILAPLQRKKLKEIIFSDTTGYQLAIRTELVHLFYKDFAKETDAFLIKFIEEQISDLRGNEWKIKSALETLYANNKSYNTMADLIDNYNWYSNSDNGEELRKKLNNFLTEAKADK